MRRASKNNKPIISFFLVFLCLLETSVWCGGVSLTEDHSNLIHYLTNQSVTFKRTLSENLANISVSFQFQLTTLLLLVFEFDRELRLLEFTCAKAKEENQHASTELIPSNRSSTQQQLLRHFLLLLFFQQYPSSSSQIDSSDELRVA